MRRPVVIGTLLAISLALNLIGGFAAWMFLSSRGGLGYLMARLTPPASDPVRDADMPPVWRSRVSLHETTPIAHGDLVMLGDSLTEWCDWPAMLGDPKARNRGIAGDSIPGVQRRLGPILRARPRQIVLLVGINDLFHHAPVAQVVAEERALIGRIRAEAPDTPLLVQSLLPVDPALVGAHWLPKIAAVNQELAKIAQAGGAGWLDLWPIFGGAKGLDPAFTDDGLHLNGAGYAAWAEALKPHLVPR